MPGQTKSEISALLAAAGLAPQHRFGQHFLIDLNLLRKLVAAAELQPGDTVLEVGAGTGSLTELLLAADVQVVAVEIDHGLQGILRSRLADHARVSLVQGDVLGGKQNVNPFVLKILQERPPRCGGTYKLVANLPYQVATPLIVDLLRTTPRFDRLVCTIQREVGARLAGAPRSDEYGPVSVIVQTLAEVTPLAIIPPTAFWPKPQVESLMVCIRPRPPEQVETTDVPAFCRLVHHAFQQRRKMVRRLLRDWDELAALAAFSRAGISPDSRPEDVAPAQWVALQRAISQMTC